MHGLKTMYTNLVKHLIYITAILKVQAAILDSRCYLEGGGSAESFLVSEDLPVGSMIGKLKINGNPHIEIGDISLSLREKNAPLEIKAGTKTLILSKELDKEDVRGPSSIYVNVICSRRNSNDPSFVVPVNVRVTDINDNAPQWISAPYSLKLSEVTVPGTRILQGIRAVDNDQQGPLSTVEYQVLPGPNSEYVQFLNPLEGTLVLKTSLDYENMRNFTVKLRAQDQGNPPMFSDTILKVIVTDADDQNPKFLRESYFGEIPVNGKPGEIRLYPESIRAVDQDEGICAVIQYSIVQPRDSKYFKINPRNGTIYLTTELGLVDLVNSATLVVKATQSDNPDRYALTTIMISRPGANTLSFIQTEVKSRVREDTPPGTGILALPTNKPGQNLNYFIPDKAQSEYFSVGSFGEIILRKPLDFEKFLNHTFEVLATDGTNNASALVYIEVMDVNDWEPRFRQTHYQFTLPRKTLEKGLDENNRIFVGRIEAADGDRNDRLNFSLKGEFSSHFYIDSKGILWIQKLDAITESEIRLIVTATDSGSPPKSTSIPVSVLVEGYELPQKSWAFNILGSFIFAILLFVLIILALSVYIIKTKKRTKTRNRVHSQAFSTASAANLVNHEKMSNLGLHIKDGNIAMANPINSMNGHEGSGSSLSAGTSTILGTTLEREVQLQQERDNYTETVRSIVSRASGLHGGLLYEGENDQDYVLNGTAGNIRNNKRLSWKNGKSDIVNSSESLEVTENNLTVYF